MDFIESSDLRSSDHAFSSGSAQKDIFQNSLCELSNRAKSRTEICYLPAAEVVGRIIGTSGCPDMMGAPL